MAELTEIEQKLKNGTELTPEETKKALENSSVTKQAGEVDDKVFEAAEEIETEEQKKAKASKKDDITPPEPGDKKAETPEPEKTPQGEEIKGREGDDTKEKLEKELSKPDGEEDLTNFSQREKGLFWELRRERRARQLLEEENSLLQQQQLQATLSKKDKTTDSQPKEEAEALPPERDPDDFVTFKDIQSMTSGKGKGKTESGEADFFKSNFLRACEEVARTKFPDYDEVIECSPEIIQNGKHKTLYASKIQEAVIKGQNPALVAYEIIKKDPDFKNTIDIARARIKALGIKLPEKKEEVVVDKGKKVEEKVEENLSKVTTSGHHSGGVDKIDAKELTLEQLSSMSQSDFRKIPKSKREYYLKKYG
jgi:hypothetical protein